MTKPPISRGFRARNRPDSQGKRVFNEADVEALGKKSGQELSKVYKVAQRLSGMSDEDIEELAKNFESGQPDDLVTG